MLKLARVSGFLDVLKDKPGMSIMAEKGFTITDIYCKILM